MIDIVKMVDCRKRRKKEKGRKRWEKEECEC